MGKLTRTRDGSLEISIKPKSELLNTIQILATKGYRCVDADKFLIIDPVRYLNSKPTNIRRERSDIAKQGSYKDEEVTRQGEVDLTREETEAGNRWRGNGKQK